jgi:lysophospholipase L1-like esterase
VASRLVFVALGDSLTVGYHPPPLNGESPRATPYTRFLAEEVEGFLSREGASGLQVGFMNRGVTGELTSDMLGRFETDVVSQRPDAVIVLGGSNDLGWGYEPSTVAENLQEIYEKARAKGMEPISCTVPSVFGFDEGIEPRLELNRLIKGCSAERGMACVDLFRATCDPPTNRLKQEYSDDGLHMTSAGYRTLGETIFLEAVRGIILRRLGGSAHS